MGQLLIWLLSQPLFWAGVGVVFGPIFFLRGFRVLQRTRLIMDTPRSTVRAAALGPIEVSGKAVGPYTIVSPISQTECFYYRIAVETNPKGDLRKQAQELCAPLFIDDGTGKLMIYPEGAELRVPRSSERSDYGKLAVAAMTRYPTEKPEFSQEYCIKPGDEILVIGTLKENPWAKKNPNAETSELSRIGPGFVSQDEADLVQHEVFMGLDPSLPAGTVLAPPEKFDFHPPVILMKGKGPFVISTESEREMVQALHWRSIVYIWGGPTATLWGLWQILSKASAAGWLPFKF